jgi:squalene-hopene/tetraprenyl-beta-curcumene cyclase
MQSCQNPDGGWGEVLASYDDFSLSGCGLSTPTQTARVLMALLNSTSPSDECVQRGVAYLVQTQLRDESENKAGTWPLVQYSATGFPSHLYMEYEYYRHYFPIMALGRYVKSANESRRSARKSGVQNVYLQ